MATKATAPQPIFIPPIQRATLEVALIGDTRLVIHAMSEKTRKELSHTESKKTGRGPKTLRVPEEEAAAALYIDADGQPVFPTRAFKAAMADAALLIDGITKTDVKRLVWIHEEFTPIESDGWAMREDIVRLAGPSRTPEVRWRPEFWPWRTTLTITTQPDLLPVEAIVNLLNWAGAFVGVGEDRPGKSGGDWGRFHVATENEGR